MAVVLNVSFSYERTQVYLFPPDVVDYVLTDCRLYVDQVKTCGAIMTGGTVAVMVFAHSRLYNTSCTSVREFKER